MKSLISRIIEIDKAAAKQMEAAEGKRQDLTESINAEKQAIYIKWEDHTKRELDAFEREESEKAEKALRRISAEEQSMLKTLDEKYSEHHEAWEDELVSRVLSV